MHNTWEDMIPFYIANTLPSHQAQALERHLTGCEACRQSVEQWRAIAGAVKEEAVEQGRGLPPLSNRVRHTMAMVPQRPDGTVLRPHTSRWTPSLVAVAASVAIVAAVGALLVLMSGAFRAPARQGSQITALMTATTTRIGPTVTATASPLAPTETRVDLGIVTPIPIIVNTRQATATQPSPVPTSTPQQPSPAPTLPPASAKFSADQTCTVVSTSGDAVAAMNRADVSSGIAGYLQPGVQPQVIAMVGGGWYEIYLQDAGTVGWVSDTTVTLIGNCSVLPLPSPTWVVDQYGLCYLSSANGGSVNVYAGPGSGYAVLNAFSINDRPDAMDVSDNGWYRINLWIGATLWIGWVSSTDVTTGGNCGSLPVIPSANYLPEHSPLETPTLPPATPTAGYDAVLGSGGFALVTLVELGGIPAGTRVATGSAYYDGTSWFYGIYTQDGIAYENAPESALAPASSTGDGG